jgi:S-adenosylmethionine:tRNA ribosyltransferase-isomerase
VKTSDFDYPLPESLIAQHPPVERDGGRMLVADPVRDRLEHATVRDLPRWLASQDLLVLNDSRVLPARLRGVRAGGGEAEVLLLRPAQDGWWEALVRPGRKLKPGSSVQVGGSALQVEIGTGDEDGTRLVRLYGVERPLDEVHRVGEMPTPPYIGERLTDADRYQTIYAREEGSAAAPTAGLHFTQRLLDAVRGRGVGIEFVTLHVGLDTFRPVQEADPAQHRMHREAFELAPRVAEAVQRTRERGGRVVAVGTTTVRVLETCATDGGTVRAGHDWSDLFIRPGFRFRVVDALLTNFHLPQSTLLMLVSAFAGRERILRAYEEAIRHGYRFYSFGDCMLITSRISASPLAGLAPDLVNE